MVKENPLSFSTDKLKQIQKLAAEHYVPAIGKERRVGDNDNVKYYKIKHGDIMRNRELFYAVKDLLKDTKHVYYNLVKLEKTDFIDTSGVDGWDSPYVADLVGVSLTNDSKVVVGGKTYVLQFGESIQIPRNVPYKTFGPSEWLAVGMINN